MAVRKRGLTFLICFRKRGYPERGRGFPQKKGGWVPSEKGGGGGVPTLKKTMFSLETKILIIFFESVLPVFLRVLTTENCQQNNHLLLQTL